MNHQQTIAQGDFLRLVHVKGWEFAERSNAYGVVAVLAVTADGQLVLTRQYRPPVDRHVIDLPAGLVGDGQSAGGESLVAAVMRELEEETGFSAGSLRHLTAFPTSPGMTSEVVDLFVADDLVATGPGGGVGGESIEVHLVPRRDAAGGLEERSRAGDLIDPKVYAALWWSARSGILPQN